MNNLELQLWVRPYTRAFRRGQRLGRIGDPEDMPAKEVLFRLDADGHLYQHRAVQFSPEPPFTHCVLGVRVWAWLHKPPIITLMLPDACRQVISGADVDAVEFKVEYWLFGGGDERSLDKAWIEPAFAQEMARSIRATDDQMDLLTYELAKQGQRADEQLPLRG